MTESQTDKIACQMVRIFGLKAQREAAMLCRKIAARGDTDGVESWTAVRRKICAIQIIHGDGEQPPDEPFIDHRPKLIA